ncbi:MAG: hypothetical protein VB030_09280 [Eubacterium aggregans]|uniref:Uncharacterized protein n=1 Tax=Eubacterium aggregans TaxID=81409 RepID=A0A1H4E634_9FIRM|nr:hypothetical protein [Eubacterium aggregans]MEA5074353.1 hypothetical protein [Eubacterium aggregans]SEA80515.1 hypothetical protein SAMN04515656_1337 [Eubacterium aggregans]
MEEQKFDEMIRETEAENAQKTPQKYTDPEKNKGAWKAKIIAGLIFAVALFGFGFYFGVKYGIQMYRMSYQISLFLAWFLPLLIILLIIAAVIYFKVRKKLKND